MTKGDDNITFNNLKIKVESDRNEYKNGILKDGINLSDCWTDISTLPHNSKEKVVHPTQKSLKLMSKIIEMVTNQNDLVLDHCCGSGTTGVACLNLNRKFIGLEIDEKYYNIAKIRVENNNI